MWRQHSDDTCEITSVRHGLRLVQRGGLEEPLAAQEATVRSKRALFLKLIDVGLALC